MAATRAIRRRCEAQGDEVLRRDRRRVDVGESLVRLVDGDGEQRKRRCEAACSDRRRHVDRVGDAPSRDDEDPDREDPRRAQEVAEARADQGGPAAAREACVVRDERHPRDRDRDHEVDAEPDRHPALALGRPELADVRLVQRPPRQVDERGEHGPQGEAANEPADEADRAHERERGGGGAEEDRPRPLRPEAEDLVRERGRRGGDDDQLEGRPAEALRDVQGRGEERPAPAERRAEKRPSTGRAHPRRSSRPHRASRSR